MRAFGWTLALVMALAGACKAEDEGCLEVRATLELERNPCEIAAGGWLLSMADGELIIERLDADNQLVELARVPAHNSACGKLVEAPETGALWVVAHDDELLLGPDHLYKLDASGELLFELEVGGETRQLATMGDDLIRAARVELDSPDMTGTSSALTLERYDGAGALLWSRLVDYPEVAEWAQSSGGPLQVSEDAIAFIASKGWIDSSTVTLIVADPADGELRWHQLLIADDFSGPHFQLGGDGQGRLFLSAQRDVVYDYDPETFERLGVEQWARATFTVLGAEGEPLATTTTEFSGIEHIIGSSLPYVDSGVVQLMFSHDSDFWPLPTTALRHDRDGQLECQGPLEFATGKVLGPVSVDDQRLMIGLDGRPNLDEEPRLYVLGAP